MISCLRWFALTLVEIKFAHKPTQVFHRLATQPKSTQVEWRPLTYYQPMKQTSQWNTGYVCLEMGFLRLLCTCEETCQSIWPATQRKSLRKFNLWLLATTCNPFDRGFTVLMTKTAEKPWYIYLLGPHIPTYPILRTDRFWLKTSSVDRRRTHICAKCKSIGPSLFQPLHPQI